MAHPCRACRAELRPHQSVAVRGKPADLFACPSCGLYEFPEPSWLDDAYADPVADIDVGLVQRCQVVAHVVETVVRAKHLQDRPLLDFGGGYGLLTRLVRNSGLRMVHHDPMAPNLFAQGLQGLPSDDYGLCTLIEVFEHLTDPREVLGRLRHIDHLLISTELVPPGCTDLESWPYVVPELGQHITFYTRRSLEVLARDHGYRLVSNGWGLHLFHRGRMPLVARVVIRRHRLAATTALALRRWQHGRSLQDEDSVSIRVLYSGSSG
jgi:hypothetical protein